MNPPNHLRCEYEVDPLGIDSFAPRLSWWLNDDSRGAAQTAYQIGVASTPEKLAADTFDLWDSGTVSSDQSIQVPYAGSSMKSRTTAFWKVRVWDQKKQATQWSAPAKWEMGLLQRSDWTGEWIGSPIVGGPYSIPPAPYLRKEFSVGGKVVSARLYVTALGFYECEINGQRVGQNRLAPGRMEYTKRVAYHVYDVTLLITSGANCAGAILGDGWYCGHLHSDPRQTYGDRPRLLAQLEVTLADGSKSIISSDDSWKAGEGPIRSSDMLMGEDYDARREIPGWSKAGFDDSKWSPVLTFADPGIALSAHRAPPVKAHETIKPIKEPTLSLNKRRHLFDMGQNMVGHVKLRVNGPAGKTIDLRYTEMLDVNGKPYTTALRSARATDHYTTKGGGEETFEPRFTFHGFRYVEVRDYPGKLTADDLVGVVVHSDTLMTGTFECSDPMINQLQKNIVWSQRGNFIDIPTDCPQRDERLGWTGDAQVFIRTAAFNADVANFFTKWLTDVEDSQGQDGRIPSVVPSVWSIHGEGGPAWADAAVICPWYVYLCYGDTRIIEQCWSTMTRFMQFLEERCVNYIRCDDHWKWKGYGDWLSMNADTPPEIIGTAFYAYSAKLMSQMAHAVGKTAEAEKYDRLFNAVKQAFIKRYVTDDGLIVAQTQTAYVLALHFDLLNEAEQPKVLDALVKNIKSRGTHLSTGFVGTPYLNPVLTRFGHNDLAYALLMQKTFPSWLFPITHGATTMWERWDGWTPEKGFNDAGMNSYNHYAFGAIGEWMYSTIAGIDLDPSKPAYKHLILRPTVGGGMTHAKATLQSMFGLIEAGWTLDGNTLILDVRVPPNSTATLMMPPVKRETLLESGKSIDQSEGIKAAGDSIELAAGRYSFSAEIV